MTEVVLFENYLSDLPNRKHQLDGLRCIAVVLVFVCHSYYFVTQELAPPKFLELTGSLGVRLFFVISGFLISRILIQERSQNVLETLKVFWIRRALRIFPLYYYVITVLLLLGKLPAPAHFYLYIYNFDFYNNQYAGPATPYWSLCVEEQFYILIPLFFLLLSPRNVFVAILLMLCASYATGIFIETTHPDKLAWALLPVSGQFLLWGCLGGIIEQKFPDKLPGTKLFFCGLVALLAWSLFVDGREAVLFAWEGFAMALIIIGLWTTKNDNLKNTFCWKPLAYIGQISYGFYVFHCSSFEIVPWCAKAIPYLNSPVIALPFCFLVSVAAATLSWYFLESPVNRLKYKFNYPK